MTKKSFQTITAEILQILRNQNRNERTLIAYIQRWRHLERFMNQRQETVLTCDICDNFLLSNIGDKDIETLTAKDKRMFRAISVVKEYITYGKLKPRKMIVYFDGEIGESIKLFIETRKKERLCNATITLMEQTMFMFLEFLKSQNVCKLEEITISHITTHIINVGAKYKSLSVEFFYHGKYFFKYLFQQKLISKDFSELIPKYKRDSHDKLPSVYNTDEIKRIINSIDRSNSVGKRNYAVMLLLSILGLRASDVARLKFSNINWDNNTIKILQYKTEKELELPLLPEIGNAIIDYLKYSRAKTDSQYIFLKVYSPFAPITSSVVSQIAKKYFIESGVNIHGKHHCSHALRHSLATTLLNENIKMPVISEVLGHSNSDSTMHYLRVNIKSLRRCAVEVPLVGDHFYNQKGGYFYEN